MGRSLITTFDIFVTFRRHEATYRWTHADDARTPTHDASSSTNDDASQAGHDATRQIRGSGFPPLFFAIKRLSSADICLDIWIYWLKLSQPITVLIKLMSFPPPVKIVSIYYYSQFLSFFFNHSFFFSIVFYFIFRKQNFLCGVDLI